MDSSHEDLQLFFVLRIDGEGKMWRFCFVHLQTLEDCAMC